jgi:hypothetical protein
VLQWFAYVAFFASQAWEQKWRASKQQLRPDPRKLAFDCGIPLYPPEGQQFVRPTLLASRVLSDLVKSAVQTLQSSDGPAKAAGALKNPDAEYLASVPDNATLATDMSLVASHSITTQVVAGGGGPAASRFPEVWAWALTYGAAVAAGEDVEDSIRVEAAQG